MNSHFPLGHQFEINNDEKMRSQIVPGNNADTIGSKPVSIVMAIALVLTVLVVSLVALKFMPANNQSDQTAVNAVQTGPANQEQGKQFNNMEYLEAFAWTARLKLEDLKLNHRLKIATSIEEGLVIKGKISTEEVSSWNEFLAWYEEKPEFPALALDVTTDAKTGNIPTLESVWFDKKPTAYFADGSFGNEGTILSDGWQIVDIESWAVFIRRKGTTITLPY